jgi:hypothetical protein
MRMWIPSWIHVYLLQSHQFGSSPFLQVSDYEADAEVCGPRLPEPCPLPVVSRYRSPTNCSWIGSPAVSRTLLPLPAKHSAVLHFQISGAADSYNYVNNVLTFALSSTAVQFLSRTLPNQFRVTLHPLQFSNFNGAGVVSTCSLSPLLRTLSYHRRNGCLLASAARTLVMAPLGEPL